MATPAQIALKVSRLKPDYFLGIANDVKGNVHFLDENTLFYPIGRILLFHNLSTDTQRYMKLPESSKIVTRIALAPNRKFVAVVEKGTKPTISIFNLETRYRVIILGNPLDSCTSPTFEFVSFTSDNEKIVAVTGPPEWTMLYYEISGRVHSYIPAMGDTPPIVDAGVTQIACNPSDPSIICIVGFGLFRFISWTDGQWVQYGFYNADKLQITCVCWVTDEIVIVGTRCGRLVAVEYGDVRGVYRANIVTEINLEKDGARKVEISSRSVPKGYKYGVYQISGLTSFPAGFAYSYTRTMVVLFSKVSSHSWVKKTVFYTVEPSRVLPNRKGDEQIRFISFSPTGQKLSCTTSRKEIYLSEVPTDNDHDEDRKVELKMFHKVLSGFHTGRVSGIATCRWKPWLLSAGRDDGCCRLWNYKTKKLIFNHYFPDDKIYSCALHPSALYCLLGLKHQLKMFMIMVDELKPIRLFRIKMCSLVEFSREGGMFAASNSAKRTIEVYCTASFENLWIFKCYNAPITAIHFSYRDHVLLTTDPDGSVNFWDLETGQDVNTKIFLDSPNYAVTSSRNDAVYVAGAEGNLKQIANGLLRTYKLNQKTLFTSALGDAEECLFVAGEKGSILSVEFPIMESALFLEFKMHSWPVRRLLVTCYDSTLISLDEQGIVGFWRIRYPRDNKQPPKIENAVELTEVVVNFKKLSEEDELIEKQQINIDRKRYQHSYIIQHLLEVKEKDLDGLSKEFLRKIDDLKKEMKANEKSYSTHTSRLQQKFEKLTKNYVAALEKQSKTFEIELMEEYLKSDELRGQMVVFAHDVRKFINMSRAATKQIFEVYEDYVSSKIREIKAETSELRLKKKSLLQKFSRETYYFEKFINDCMDRYKEYHSRRLIKLKKRKEYLKDEILFLIKKSSTLEDKIKSFYSSGMKHFKYLDEMRVDSRILKTKNNALQLMLDAVDAQAKKKDELILFVRKLLKSDSHEQMEKTERLENIKLVLRPMVESEIKKFRETEADLQSKLVAQRNQIISVGLCIAAVERQISVCLKKKTKKSAFGTRVKKCLDEIKTDLISTNSVSDNRDELKKSLAYLYRNYINPKATEQSMLAHCCTEGGLNFEQHNLLKQRLSETEKTGLEDVVEFHQMERMLKRGEKSLGAEIKIIRKQLVKRPTLLVGYKHKKIDPTKFVNIINEINTYRYRVADALETLASEKRSDIGCFCKEHNRCTT